MKKLARRPAIASLILAMMLLVGHVLGDSPSAAPSSRAAAAAPTPRGVAVQTEKDLEKIDDPVTLIAAGRHHLAAGNEKLARKCFEASITKHEVNLYDELAGTDWATALVHEHMGELAQAEKIWRASFEADVLRTVQHLAHFSIHPKKKELLEAAKAHLLGIVEAAKRGEQAVIYVTKKGAKRYLEVVSADNAEKAFLAGERLQYAYIEELNLSGRTWPARVGCYRCVTGKIEAWSAKFEDQLDFNGFVLGDVHLGKHWHGEVNKSSFDPPAHFNRLYLDHGVFLGKVDLDSVVVEGRIANFPFATFLGPTNLRNVDFQGTAEFRFAHFEKPASFKGARFSDSAYFAYAHFGGLDLSRARSFNRPVHFASATFAGDLLVEDAIFAHPVTFENARFDGSVRFSRCRFDEPLNMSRIVTTGNFTFEHNEAEDVLFYGGQIKGSARFDSCMFSGRVRFSLDELTRRQHLENVTPLHKLYKLYQGDDDAEEDLTTTSQYGVTHVDDLVSRFYADVSFANTSFEQFVGFERVIFGSEEAPGLASFYNVQFGGEAHFERARFYGIADFRTVGGEELSFNQARFHRHWLLDDANIPGRLSTNEADLVGDATLSLAGADIASLGIDFRQLLERPDRIWDRDKHRLFYERCLLSFADNTDPEPYINDPRLVDAQWDASGEVRLSDPAAIAARAEELCIDRTIDEYVRLKDSFAGRSMGDESDWAYWHLKHYTNHKNWVKGDLNGKIYAVFERLLFEKGFGWGVLLSNLAFTSAAVILLFALLLRIFCADMELEWDGEPTRYKDLSLSAVLIISTHCFLGGFGYSEEPLLNSTATYKYLYTSEMVIGIIVITFFIGAYTRLVVAG